jgi:hypothetical protein
VYVDYIHYIDFDDSKIFSLRKAFGDLELKMTTGSTADFLDIKTNIDKISGELIISKKFQRTFFKEN